MNFDPAQSNPCMDPTHVRHFVDGVGSGPVWGSQGGSVLSFPCRHAASRLPAWFWHTAVIYHYSYSTVTAPFPRVATIPPYFTLASLHFLFTSLSPLFPPFPPTPFPSLLTPPIYAYRMPVQLHYIQLCRLRDPRRRLWRHVIKK